MFILCLLGLLFLANYSEVNSEIVHKMLTNTRKKSTMLRIGDI